MHAQARFASSMRRAKLSPTWQQRNVYVQKNVLLKRNQSVAIMVKRMTMNVSYEWHLVKQNNLSVYRQKENVVSDFNITVKFLIVCL